MKRRGFLGRLLGTSAAVAVTGETVYDAVVVPAIAAPTTPAYGGTRTMPFMNYGDYDGRITWEHIRQETTQPNGPDERA